MVAAADWAWWVGLLLGAIPLLALAVWHCNDAFHCAAFAFKRWRSRRGASYRLPPGHMGLPFVGESLQLGWYFTRARRPDGFVDAKRRRYGAGAGVYRTHLFGSPSVLVCSPEANKFVLQSPDSFGIRWPAPELVGLSSMLNVEGSRHARLRGFVVAAINSPRSLRTIAEVVQPRVVAALQSWAEKGTIITGSEIKKVTFENICKMFVSMEPSPLTDKIDSWFAGLVAGIRGLFPVDLPGTAFRHALSCRKKLNAVFREELEKRRSKELPSDDLMGGLMQMEDEHGKKLCDDEVLDNIVSLVLGGYESTASAITWAAYLLAKSPHVLRNLREENLEICRGTNGGLITVNDIASLKYTANVVEETIRIANIASMVFRVAHEDVEYRGYTIPKRWRIVVWLRSMHTDPNNFDDPLCFNPDRWDKPGKPGTFQAFGGGHRICAGNKLARLQLTIMLHHLSVGYKWKLLNPDAEIVYLPHPRPSDGAAMSFTKL